MKHTAENRGLSEQHGSQLVLLAHADRRDGAIVELEGGAAVHHHAGVPAPGAHAHLLGKSSLATAGEDSVHDGLADAEEQAAVFRAEHQRPVVLLGNSLN